MRRFLFLQLLIISSSILLVAQKQYNIIKTTSDIKIDAVFDEVAWNNAQIAKDFTQLQPESGAVPTSDADVRLTYDDKAIYVSAFIHEVSRDSIMTEMSQRDDISNTDWFGILIDTYGNGTDGLEFIVQSTGVQFDAKLGDNGDDESWDAVWKSAIRLVDDGWYVEMEIPYAAIRFPNQEIQEWKINFIKVQARTGEKSLWNPFDPEKDGFIRQFGDLLGLKGIKSPLRLSISPYFSGYANNTNDIDNGVSNSYSYNGGMDLKYGINDAFTLDMTLVPDFGQVKSDDLILNLGPFETRYSENRQFFTEGIELFQKGNLFYSRRIGDRPIGYDDVEAKIDVGEEVIAENPISSKLYNATKVSGRTSSGLGIGVFNAVSGRSFATINPRGESQNGRLIQTSPITNYNLVVLDQNLKNNSSVSFANSSVIREGSSYYDAVVTATEFDVKNKKQNVRFSGSGAISQLYYTGKEDDFGHRYNLEVEKIGGLFTYGLSYNEESDTFDPNDLGFLYNNNERNIGLSGNYQIVKKNRWLTRGNVWTSIDYTRLYAPNVYTNTNLNIGFWGQTLGLWKVNMWANISPKEYDYFETRTEGRYYLRPSNGNVGIWISSDRRKRFRVNTNASVNGKFGTEQFGYSFRLSPRYRISDKITFRLVSSFNQSENSRGYVDKIGNNSEIIVFGKRDRTTLTNVAFISYILNNKMGLNFRARHYWSKVSYDDFFKLASNGTLDALDYKSKEDFSYSNFSIDLDFKWRFAPGSDLIFAWKNNIQGVSDDDEINYQKLTYFEGINALDLFPKNNSISLKVAYYIDYNRLRGQLKS